MWEMTYICEKIPQVFDKRLKYVENDVNLWYMSQICWEMT